MAFRSSDRNYRGGTGDLILNKPAGTAEHDVLVIGMTGYQLTYNLPSGFLQIGTDLDVAGPDGQRISVFRKVAGASEPSDYTITITSGFEPTAFIMSFSGRDTASPISAYQPSSSASSNPTPITLSMTGVTAAAGDDMLTVYAGDTTQAADRWSGSPPDGYTEREDYDPQDWSGIYAHTLDNVSAGATGTLQPMLTRTVGSGGAGWLGFVIALKAAAGGSGAVLEASAADVVSATGALSTSITLQSAALTVASATAGIGTQIKLNGAAVDVVSATAGLTTQSNFGGSAVDVVTATGNLTTQINLAGSAADIASATGNLTAQVKLNASAVVQALSSAGLNTSILLGGNAQDTAVATASLTTQIKFTGSAQSVATAAAGLVGSATQLNGNAADVVSATAALSTAIPLQGNAQDVVTLTASITTQIGLTANALTTAISTGQLITQVKFNGFAVNSVTATGDLSTVLLTILGARRNASQDALGSKRSAFVNSANVRRPRYN